MLNVDSWLISQKEQSAVVEAELVSCPGAFSKGPDYRKSQPLGEMKLRPGVNKLNFKVKMENPVLWSPENPFLYDIKVRLVRNGSVIDEVTSYAGMRKISVAKTEDGFTRILLNNKFVWQLGPLDQGFWPDGIYTPPTEEAMKSLNTRKDLLKN